MPSTVPSAWAVPRRSAGRNAFRLTQRESIEWLKSRSAEHLSGFIDEGNALVRQFLKDDDADALAAQARAWELKVEQVVSSTLDPQLAKRYRRSTRSNSVR